VDVTPHYSVFVCECLYIYKLYESEAIKVNLDLTLLCSANGECQNICLYALE